MSTIRILLVSVGSLVGQNLLEVISHARKSFFLVGSNSQDDFHTRCLLDEFHLSPLTSSDDFSAYLEDLIQAVEPDLVIPCRDEEVVLLARIVEKNPSLKSKVSLHDSRLAIQFLDKYLSSVLCNDLGLPFAQTIRLADFANQMGFPMILKPREGFASKGVRVMVRECQLKPFQGNGNDHILQEYLSEDPSLLSDAMNFAEQGFPLHFSFEENKYSIQLHVTEIPENASWFIGVHRMKNGVSYQVGRFNDHALESLTSECLRKFFDIGFRGPLNIQLQRDKFGDFKIYEFNCRFTGATSSRFYLGHNELELLLMEKTGKSPFGMPASGFSKARKVVKTIGIK